MAGYAPHRISNDEITFTKKGNLQRISLAAFLTLCLFKVQESYVCLTSDLGESLQPSAPTSSSEPVSVCILSTLKTPSFFANVHKLTIVLTSVVVILCISSCTMCIHGNTGERERELKKTIQEIFCWKEEFTELDITDVVAADFRYDKLFSCEKLIFVDFTKVPKKFLTWLKKNRDR